MNTQNISNESKKATRKAASKNTAELEALRKMATAMIGKTFQWANGKQYRLESFEKVTKNKVTFWLSEPPRHHDIYTMDFSRTMLEHLQATGEHRTDYGTTIREVSEAEKPLAYIMYCRGMALDIFKDWGKAVADLSRHVYGTLQDCYGGKVSKESESRYQVYFKEGDKWEVCEVLPIDLNRPKDQETYKAIREAENVKEAEGVKVGDKVRHNWTGDRVATVTGIRRVQGYKWEDEITVYRLDFGESVKGPFGMEMNGGEYQREAFRVVPDYYSEYQRLDHQEARPTEWIEKATSEEREAYYRTCVELERMAGDGLPLVIRADSADLSVNPWNALEKRVKTARVFHLGDHVKVKDGSREVTGIVNGIRCNEGSLALGGWCTHYNIQWDKQYQYTTGYGTVTGCGNIGPERIELIERAESCPEPAAEWLQPGEKVAHYLDYGDGTGDWLTGNVTGYDLDDNGKGVTVIYGEYRTPLKGMVKYQPEMDGEAA